MPKFSNSRLKRRRALLGRDNPIRPLRDPIREARRGGEKRKVGHLYKDRRWGRLRKQVLEEQPMCEVCGEELATTVDHIVRHRGDPELFFDRVNLQALCLPCHNEKSRQEKRLPLLENTLSTW